MFCLNTVLFLQLINLFMNAVQRLVPRYHLRVVLTTTVFPVSSPRVRRSEAERSPYPSIRSRSLLLLLPILLPPYSCSLSCISSVCFGTRSWSVVLSIRGDDWVRFVFFVSDSGWSETLSQVLVSGSGCRSADTFSCRLQDQHSDLKRMKQKNIKEKHYKVCYQNIKL